MRLMTIQEASTYLTCSERHARRMIAAGKLATIDIGLGKQKVLRVQVPKPEATMKGAGPETTTKVPT